jgi:hypothetical protein
MLLSRLPLTIWVPSGEKAAELTVPVCPVSVATSLAPVIQAAAVVVVVVVAAEGSAL